jgi:hypothetical protein
MNVDDGKAEVVSERTSRRAHIPSQVKVEEEMVAKVRRQLELIGIERLVRDIEPELQKPTSLGTGLRTLHMSN